jgi:hypothetical protein
MEWLYMKFAIKKHPEKIIIHTSVKTWHTDFMRSAKDAAVAYEKYHYCYKAEDGPIWWRLMANTLITL